MDFDKRQSDQEFLGRLKKPASNLSVATLFLSVCLLFGLLSFTLGHLTSRVTLDEASTCAIQARGLPASHELSSSMSDIYRLLTLPRGVKAPPPDPRVTAIVTDLTPHLSSYVLITSKQPQSRKCS